MAKCGLSPYWATSLLTDAFPADDAKKKEILSKAKMQWIGLKSKQIDHNVWSADTIDISGEDEDWLVLKMLLDFHPFASEDEVKK